MSGSGRAPWWLDAVRGGIAGGLAVAAMDVVTTGLQASQSEASAAAEKAVQPNGKSSVANLVDRVADAAGVDPDNATREQAAQVVHYALGVVPGALYGIARSRLPLVGAASGLLYGAGLWALNDEYANSALGLAAPFDAYPIDTHVRGALGHFALGLVTDTGIDLLGG
ncbi:MAG: DUF1440 domain-containing protein [Chloroflexota bacterium]|nr:DUF1440 domain-containing protein [Chloroflexota bacterium]